MEMPSNGEKSVSDYSHTPSAQLRPVPGARDRGPVISPTSTPPGILGCSGCRARLHPHTNPHRAILSVLFCGKLWRALRTHRQTELQVLLRHKQQIPVQRARQRHCSPCSPHACVARSVPYLFSPDNRAFPLRRSLKRRKRKFGKAGAVPGILARAQREGLPCFVRLLVEAPKHL